MAYGLRPRPPSQSGQAELLIIQQQHQTKKEEQQQQLHPLYHHHHHHHQQRQAEQRHCCSRLYVVTFFGFPKEGVESMLCGCRRCVFVCEELCGELMIVKLKL